MAFFEFPHTRTYDSDLGWLIWAMKKLIGDMEEFTEINSIKFGDPINWNIATQYEPTTIVIDNDGNGYISRKAVPAGIALTDGEYWTRIFNFSEITENLTNGIAYNNGGTPTALKAFLKDELVWFNNRIYRVLYDIAAGTALIDGTNIEATTFAEYILDVKTSIDETETDLTNRMDSLETDLNGRMTTLTTLVNTTMEEVRTITTELQENVNQQVETLQNNVNQQVETLQNDVNQQLTDFQQGVDDDIAATEQRLSAQITREVQEQIGGIDDGIGGALKGKKIAVLGDSNTIGSGEALGHTWVENLATDYGAITYNYGVSGSSISIGGTATANTSMVTRIDSILNQHDKLDYFILSGGGNDKNFNVEIGTQNSTTNATLIGAIKTIINKVRTKYQGRCKILMMTTYRRYDTFNGIGKNEWDYVQGMIVAGNYFSIPVFNNYNNCGISLYHDTQYPNTNEWADIYYATGKENPAHLSKAGHKYLTPIYANWIVNSFNTNTMAPAVYENVNGTLFMKSYLPNNLMIVAIRRYVNTTTSGSAVAGTTYTGEQTIDIPKKFQVNSGIVTDAFYGVQGVPGSSMRSLTTDANGNITQIKFVAARMGVTTTGTEIKGFYTAIMVGFFSA